MLKIRLARFGKKKHPTYRIVVSDSRKDLRGTYKEVLGTYNPIVKPVVMEVQKERVTHWLFLGAQLSATVNNLFVDHHVITGQKVKASPSYRPPKQNETLAGEPVAEKSQQ